MFHLRTLLVCLLAGAVVAGSLPAQPASAAPVQGVMTDDSGAVVPAANVTLAGKGPGRSAQTQVDGSYSFTGVAPGQYHVKVAFPGFTPVDKAVTVAPGANLNVPIQLTI